MQKSPRTQKFRIITQDGAPISEMQISGTLSLALVTYLKLVVHAKH